MSPVDDIIVMSSLETIRPSALHIRLNVFDISEAETGLKLKKQSFKNKTHFNVYNTISIKIYGSSKNCILTSFTKAQLVETGQISL